MNKFVKGMFANLQFGEKIALLLGLFVIMNVFGNAFGFLLEMVGGKFLSEMNNMRMVQFVASMMIFVGTPLAFYYLTAETGDSIKRFFKFERRNSLILYVLAVVSLSSLLPLVNYTACVNEQMTLPESLKAIENAFKEMEDLAKVLTEGMLKVDSFPMLIINLIVIAAAPAIGEELMFRGALQKTLCEKWSPAIAIIISSVVFSALHFQFYGFIPRFVLSICLGLLFHLGGSIKLNMFAHFTNNAMAVVVYYICTVMNISTDDAPTETLGKEDFVPALVSIAIFTGVIWLFYKIAKDATRESESLKD